MLPVNDLFTEADRKAIYSFLDTYPRYLEVVQYRTIPARHVKTIFYGDSITSQFPYHEFFHGASLLNRGIGGDNVDGLYFRLEDDVFPYTPKQVVMMIGINGIGQDAGLIVRKIAAVAELIAQPGARVWLCSILPLRHGDSGNRFQYQDQIVAINDDLRRLATARFAGFLDYHAAVRDEQGELAEAYAQPDGTHVNFAAYVRMAEVLRSQVDLF